MNTLDSLRHAAATEGSHGTKPASLFQLGQEALSNTNLSLITTGSRTVKYLEAETETLKSSTVDIQQLADSVISRKLQFSIERELDSVIIKIIDLNTDEVIKEIPSEDIQKLKIRIRKTTGLLFDELI